MCVCVNRLELGVSKAIKDRPRLKQLNDVLIFLYEQYHYCPKVLRELTMLGEALQEKVHKPSNLRVVIWDVSAFIWMWTSYEDRCSTSLQPGYAIDRVSI